VAFGCAAAGREVRVEPRDARHAIAACVTRRPVDTGLGTLVSCPGRRNRFVRRQALTAPSLAARSDLEPDPSGD
jgi:hypothetical protein